MNFEVAFVPPDAVVESDSVCIVIDVIRATSTIVTLFEKGTDEVRVSDDISPFLSSKKGSDNKEFLVCAEDFYGHCMKNANFSPSLHGIEKLANFNGKTILMQTTNGTVAIHALASKNVKNIFLGCMLNSKSVMQEAISLANKLSTDILIVCAGRDHGKSYTIDDVYCAASLLKHGLETANEKGIDIHMRDSAKIATKLLEIYPNAKTAFDDSASGNTMRKIDCIEDITLCSRENVSLIVPFVYGHSSDKHIIVKNYILHNQLTPLGLNKIY